MVGIGKPKPTPISPFLFQVYCSKDNLTEQEEDDYEATRELISYRINPEAKPYSNPASEGEDPGTRNPDATTKAQETEEPQRKLNWLK